LEVLDNSMVAKLEFQANYLASCLLVPKDQLVKIFSKIYDESGLKRRGVFWIYLDNQPENKMIANNIVSKLARYFNVSKSVIKIRLVGFGLLHDERLKLL
jgi:Zn-dependent peptidase ImmA (M78 family)